MYRTVLHIRATVVPCYRRTNIGGGQLGSSLPCGDYLPRDCFINLYPIGKSAGVNNHRDQSSFCSVVYCLLGDGSNLILIKETGDMEEVNLKTNDMLVFQ